MADRAASGIAIRLDGHSTNPVLNLKVTEFEIDPEVRWRRSITSDGRYTNGQLIPITVIESIGGIIHGKGFVDPTDTLMAAILLSIGGAYTPGTTMRQRNINFLFDVVNYASGSMPEFFFGEGTLFVLIIPKRITGVMHGEGMVEIEFEIHSDGLGYLTDGPHYP